MSASYTVWRSVADFVDKGKGTDWVRGTNEKDRIPRRSHELVRQKGYGARIARATEPCVRDGYRQSDGSNTGQDSQQDTHSDSTKISDLSRVLPGPGNRSAAKGRVSAATPVEGEEKRELTSSSKGGSL